MMLPSYFNVRCSSVKESHEVQRYLFTLGLEWCYSGVKLTNALCLRINFSSKVMSSNLLRSLPTLTSAKVLPPSSLLRKHHD